MVTEIGPIELEVPRDRAGTFEPVIVAKRRRRLVGVDQMVLSLSAKGLTHGEISAHLEEIYQAKVSKETVTRITDGVMETMSEWQARPLDAGRSPSVVANVSEGCPHAALGSQQSAGLGEEAVLRADPRRPQGS